MTGTLVNAASIVAGASLGLALRRRSLPRAADTAMHGLGLAVLLIGTRMALEAFAGSGPHPSVLMVLVSLAAGGYLGELWQLEQGLDRFGRWVEQRVASAAGGEFARSFVSSSLLFVVGPMTVVGSLNDGMFGDWSLLLTKSVMDGIASVAFASTMGPGVMLSAGTVLVYQGALTAVGAWLGRAFDPLTLSAWSATGGLLVLAIGLNMLGATRLRTANLLPSLALAALLAPLWARVGLP
ncbi:MAG TPA: DUF554 domain-containing protein [Limnochordales bacterium]